jgi:predicted HicB family RNase H-like nuclease
MKKEPSKKETQKQVTDSNEQTTEKAVVLKKSKKDQQSGDAEILPKSKKTKVKKTEKSEIEPKQQKAPKDDKITKFLVSMKKSVRKTIKKEAAEAGISMNEFIVVAVVEKLNKAPH